MSQKNDWLSAIGREVFSQKGRGIQIYHYFARSVGLLLSVAVAIIMMIALFYLFVDLVKTVFAGPPAFDYKLFQHFFEMVLTALIALEFNHTLTEIVTGRSGLIQVKAVVLIGILVIVRKFILLEIETTPAMFLVGLAFATLALGIVYWLVADVDRREDMPAEDL